jgi:hypothetical protein
MRDGYESVQQRWPDGGPYSHERTIAAAEAIAQLLRYLNDVARSTDAVVPHPDTVYRVLSGLAAATGELDQLLHRLLGCLELAGSTAHDDRHDRPATDTVFEVAAEVAGARVSARVLAEQMNRAARHAAHLRVGE